MINLGSILPVGTIIHSMLTTTQFAAEYGTNWILADGSSVTGSKYAAVTGNSTVPDMTGRFLRGKGANNPDGDLALGTYSVDKYKSHQHTIYADLTGGGSLSASSVIGDAQINPGTQAYETTGNILASGDNETAPKSITVNIFIRIN